MTGPKWIMCSLLVYCLNLQKSFLVGLAIIAAVGADVSHLASQQGYNYEQPSPSFNDVAAVLPENDYLPPQQGELKSVSFDDFMPLRNNRCAFLWEIAVVVFNHMCAAVIVMKNRRAKHQEL